MTPSPPTEFCYVIRNLEQDKYLAQAYYHIPWTRSLTRAKFFISRGDADAVAANRGGVPDLIMMRHADWEDVALAEEIEEMNNHDNAAD